MWNERSNNTGEYGSLSTVRRSVCLRPPETDWPRCVVGPQARVRPQANAQAAQLAFEEEVVEQAAANPIGGTQFRLCGVRVGQRQPAVIGSVGLAREGSQAYEEVGKLNQRLGHRAARLKRDDLRQSPRQHLPA